ncbi:MAG: SMC-Scp complex subunit ScpB [Pseudomonadota bacterium]|nr:SMC-Scp complex subunit ScpB [Pseudomonadota bacterium]
MSDHDDEDNVVAFRPLAIERPPAPEGEAEGEGGPPPPELLVPTVEACLFAAAGIVTVAQLAAALKLDTGLIESALEALGERLRRTGSGVRLAPVGDGWQLRTEARLAPWVAAIRGGKPAKLSRAALETLAVVAFRQPVSKGIVDDLRGVDCGGVLRMLLDRGLLKIVGRSDDPGRPLTYGTTPAFLELFGMRSLADLPTLKDLRVLRDDDTPDGGVVPFPEGGTDGSGPGPA